MMMYSHYNRVKRYFKRNIFILFFASKFKKFGKKTSIFEPDIIEGEKYISLGNNVSLNSKAWLLALHHNGIEPELTLEDGATIGRFIHIVAIKKVLIEKNVLIADKVYISDNIHAYKNVNVPILNQEILFKGEVVIGENSWIGENVSIVGAKIGKHCIVGSNSFVNKDIPDYCVAVGTPAKVIKKYNFEAKQWQNV